MLQLNQVMQMVKVLFGMAILFFVSVFKYIIEVINYTGFSFYSYFQGVYTDISFRIWHCYEVSELCRGISQPRFSGTITLS